jgi:hypothetical protein
MQAEIAGAEESAFACFTALSSAFFDPFAFRRLAAVFLSDDSGAAETASDFGFFFQ